MDLYDVVANTWTTGLPSMPYGVTNPGSASLGGRLYCIGGSNQGNPLQGTVFNYVQIYQPEAYPSFFTGQVSLGSGVYYLQFPDNNPFAYYNFPSNTILYHYDMGFEGFIAGSASDIYLYEFTSGHWFYTSTTLFPYLYDFTLTSWLYYFPSTTTAGHYSSNPRYFSNLTTGKIITM
jgi:hypothetical protein